MNTESERENNDKPQRQKWWVKIRFFFGFLRYKLSRKKKNKDVIKKIM